MLIKSQTEDASVSQGLVADGSKDIPIFRLLQLVKNFRQVAPDQLREVNKQVELHLEKQGGVSDFLAQLKTLAEVNANFCI